MINEIIWSIIATASLVAGIVLVVIGNNKKVNGQGNLPMIISGWVIIVVTTIASIVGLIIGINSSEVSAGTFLLTTVIPVLILFGFIFALGLGVANLVKGYEKNGDGSRNNSKIISGWALLIIAIVLVLALVITISFVFNQQSGKGEPVRFM